MKNLIFIFFLILIINYGCKDDNSFKEYEGEPLPVVVEGWIEEGEAPVVIVTRAIDLTENIDSIGDITEKWGRVTIFDNDEPYILTGRLNKNYTPSFIFTSSRLKGIVGHTYRLLIELENETLEASSTILPVVNLEQLETVKVEDSDSLYFIRARISGIDDAGYYKFFAKSNDTETRFYPTFLGTFKGSDYDDDKGIYINRGIHSAFNDEGLGHFYKSGDIVEVKLCSIEPKIFEFWQAYDRAVSLSQNLFFTLDQGCPSNINKGKGYWAAYGVSQRVVRIP